MDNEHIHEEGISLSRLLNMLWHWKWLIVLGTLITTVSVTIFVLLMPKTYQSKAVVSVSEFHRINRAWEPSKPPPTGLSMSEYNNFLGAIKNHQKMTKFLEINGYLNEGGNKKEKFDWGIRPTYAFPMVGRRKKEANYVISLNVTAQAHQPEKARERALWIGRYCMNLLLNSELHSYFGSLKVILDSSYETLGNRIYDAENAIADLREKEAFIQKEIFSIKGIENIGQLDLKNVNARSERYLSPHRQLVAVKIAIKDEEIKIRNLRQRLEDSELLSDYLGKVYHLLDEEGNFLLKEDVLEKLQKETDTYFTDQIKKKFKGAYFRVALSLTRFSKLQQVVYRFDTYPSNGIPHFRFKRKAVIAFTLFLSFFCFLFLALILEWVKINKKKIMEP